MNCLDILNNISCYLSNISISISSFYSNHKELLNVILGAIIGAIFSTLGSYCSTKKIKKDQLETKLTMKWRDVDMILAVQCVTFFNERIKTYRHIFDFTAALKSPNRKFVNGIPVDSTYSEHCTLIISFLESLKIYHDKGYIKKTFIKNLVGSQAYDLISKSTYNYYKTFIYKNTNSFDKLLDFYKDI